MQHLFLPKRAVKVRRKKYFHLYANRIKQMIRLLRAEAHRTEEVFKRVYERRVAGSYFFGRPLSAEQFAGLLATGIADIQGD